MRGGGCKLLLIGAGFQCQGWEFSANPDRTEVNYLVLCVLFSQHLR